MTGSITYLAASNRWPRSSIDENTPFLWPDCTGNGLSVHTLVQPPQADPVSSESEVRPTFAYKLRWAVTVPVGLWPPGPVLDRFRSSPPRVALTGNCKCQECCWTYFRLSLPSRRPGRAPRCCKKCCRTYFALGRASAAVRNVVGPIRLFCPPWLPAAKNVAGPISLSAAPALL